MEGVKSTKRFLGMPEDKDLFVPDGVYEHFAAGVGARGREARTSREARIEAYRTIHPELADELERIQRRDLPEGCESALPTFPADPEGIASRESSGRVLATEPEFGPVSSTNALIRHYRTLKNVGGTT
ncbi:hypothetical protein ACIRYZ_24325 [Kitasatospora sp. NPDC101155]|uniref:hypothetical protein n=1 Tax=Kitasatospora sp. NPDC101155 TaxID=3364097 RepID=UPI00380D32A4